MTSFKHFGRDVQRALIFCAHLQMVVLVDCHVCDQAQNVAWPRLVHQSYARVNEAVHMWFLTLLHPSDSSYKTFA